MDAVDVRGVSSFYRFSEVSLASKITQDIQDAFPLPSLLLVRVIGNLQIGFEQRQLLYDWIGFGYQLIINWLIFSFIS